MRITRARGAAVTAAALTLTLTLAACSGGSDGGSTDGGGGGGDVTAADIDAALDAEGTTTLQYWSWVPNLQPTVDLWNEAHPNIQVELTNAGQSADQYTKLQNAIKAGSGAPDLAQIEYFALPQFALGESLVSLDDVGLSDLESDFTASAWEQVAAGDGHYAFPQDTGPMVMFYRADILERLGVEAPTTWDEFLTVARAIKADNPENFIASIDPGDAGGVDSLIWQAEGRPFSVEGTDVNISFDDEGTQKFNELWDTLISEKLVDVAGGWNDAFWRSLDSGRYAMWMTGAWAPGSLETNVPSTAGSWKAATMPVWEAGTPANAENGGSGTAVLAKSENKAAALAFARWLSTDSEAVQAQVDAGLFPSTSSIMADTDFLGATSDFFGGQAVNEVFVQASKDVSSGWQYLPFQVYANSVFGDTAGQAFSNATPIADGLTAWQDQITTYGNGQGFKVTND
ncbi:sugar ABC transporter substrate-binding protein [Oerskovia sp. Root918]|uniref:ABC transporter substrate-binding protein n=1 Tax=Oerskovia sp. Root918 TaxID=1736607 RepID=UPI0006FD2272|nr:sugar ABC transporter substrate-binding protein [Oerskovia sp. Root918]KRD42686.1 sugar ABC transporter substrate-binding protein [Oerskovia sp. Root918]